MDRHAKLFISGAGIISIGAFACGYLSLLVLYLGGIPVLPLVAGLVLIWITRFRVLLKIAVTASAVLWMAIGFAVMFAMLPRAEPETYLIPANFRGTFVVDFVSNCGDHIQYKNGRRTYRIPMNGVLVLNGERTTGVMDQRFYLISESGHKEELQKFDYQNYHDEQGARWLPVLKGNFTRETVGVFHAYWNIQAFTISNFQNLEAITKSEREAENATLQSTLESERKRLGCERIQ